MNELSFGPFYPKLLNPLDESMAITEQHFHKYQYYVSVVPTIYTDNPRRLARLNAAGHSGTAPSSSDTIFTNQYAVTSQSRPVSETTVPGIFVKYSIEPIVITIAEEKASWSGLLIRLVNVVSGVLVAGGWCYQLAEWVVNVAGSGSIGRRGSGLGMLTGWKEKGDV